MDEIRQPLDMAIVAKKAIAEAGAIAVILTPIIKLAGLAITNEQTIALIAIPALLAGLFRGGRNWFKHKNRKN